MRACYRFLTLVACLVFNTSTFASVYTENAYEWLSGQQTSDGGLFAAGDISLPGQSTAEVLEAYLLYSGDSRPDEAKAKDYLRQQVSSSTEFLARAMLQGLQSTHSIPSVKSLLEERQNFDGGFGDQVGFDSSAHDTYWALSALDLGRQMDSQNRGRAIGYLLDQQRTDGSWGYSDGGSYYLTARITALLSRYNTVYVDISGAISEAEVFLRNAVLNGEVSDVFLQSAVLNAMSGISSSPQSWGDLAGFLQTAQNPNGSWNNDVYVTALAARALSVYEARLAVGSRQAVIRGQVVKAGSLAPVSNATISVIGGDIQVQANDDGTFVINGLEAGQYNILVSHPGFNQVAISQTLSKGQIVDAGYVALALLSDKSVLSGRVTDGQTGDAVQGVRVELAGEDTLVLSTGSDGTFQAADLEAGDYTVTLSAEGYYPQVGNLTLEVARESRLVTSLVPVSQVLDDSPGQVSGRLLDGETQQPIAGGLLALEGGAIAQSSVDGSFAFADVPRGSHALSVQSEGYVSSQFSFAFAPGSSGRLGDVAVFPQADNQAPEVTELTVYARHAVTKQPLANVELSVDSGNVGTTNSAGFIVVSDINALQFDLVAVLEGFIASSGTLTTPAFGSYTTTVELTPESDNTYTETTLSGVVTDADGVALSGVVVEYPVEQLSVTTDEAGRYLLDGIQSLSGEVVATRSGYQTRQLQVAVQQHGQYQLDIALEPVGDAVFQVAYVSLSNPTPGLDENVQVKARVINLSSENQNVLVTGQIQSADGSEGVASLSAINPGAGGGLGGVIQFAPGEIKELELPWNAGQTPAGSYSAIVNVVREGSVSRALPEGDIYANGQAQVTLSPQMRIAGGFPFDPPLTQAGTTQPVSLAMVLRNSGNTVLSAGDYSLSIASEEGEIVFAQPVAISELALNEVAEIDLGEWQPGEAGHYSVTLTRSDRPEVGEISAVYYVGDVASGLFTLDQTVFTQGDHQTRGHIELTGVDTTETASTDPLFDQVREALRRGANYVGPAAATWHRNNRCLGCHTQTQSLVGLAASQGRADFDGRNSQFLYNAIAGSQQSDGILAISHNGYKKTQTALGVWSLSEWGDKTASYRTQYNALKNLWSLKSTSGSNIYWINEHQTGWLSLNYQATSALVARSSADLIRSFETGVADDVSDYSIVETGTIPNASGNLRGITATNNGLLIARQGQVQRFNVSSGESELLYQDSANRNLYDVVQLDDGTIYASGDQRLVKISSAGETSEISIPGAALTNLTVWQGKVYAAVPSRNQVLAITADDSWSIFASSLSYPLGLAVSEENELIVANRNGYNLLAFREDGQSRVFADGLAFPPEQLASTEDGRFLLTTAYYNRSGQSTPPGVALVRADGTVESIARFNNMGDVVVADGQWFVANNSTWKLSRIVSSPMSSDIVEAYRQALPNMAGYFLSGYTNNDNEILRIAFRLVGLAEIRSVSADEALNGQIDTAIQTMADLLRQRQRADGGWGRYNSSASDPLTTAWVGIALDYTNPSVNDPVVRRTIQYLLSAQQGNGDWTGQYFSTRLGTTSMVMAFMPKALARLGGLDVDLELNLPENIQLDQPTVAPSVVESTETGTRYQWQLTGVTERGQNIDFNLAVSNLLAGESRSVADLARLSFANSFNGETLTRDIDIPVVRGVSDMGLALSTDKPTYRSGEQVTLSNVVTSLSGSIDSARVDIVIRTAGHEFVADVGTLSDVDVPAGDANTSILEWNSVNVLAGDYQAVARLYDQHDQLQGEAVADFLLEATDDSGLPVDRYATSVYSDKPVYRPWDAVNLNGRVANTAVNQTQKPALAIMDVTDTNGEQLFQRKWVVAGLAANGLRDLPHSLQLDEALAGQYQVSLQLWNSSVDEILSSASATFTVEEDLVQAVTGSVSVNKRRIEQGETAVCTDRLANRSSRLTALFAYRQMVVSAADQTVISEDENNLSIAPQKEWSAVRSQTTDSLALGEYACVLQSNLGGKWQTVGAAAFEVVEPPIQFSADIALGNQGRLLVLTDAPRECKVTHKLSYQIQVDAAIAGKTALKAIIYDRYGNQVDSVSVKKESSLGFLFSSGYKGLFTSASVTKEGLLTVEFDKPEGLDDGYEVRLSAGLSGEIETAHWNLRSGCSLEEYLNAWEGDKRLTGFEWLPHSGHNSSTPNSNSDPYGPHAAPGLNEQNAALEQALQNAGWDYTLVHEARDFTREFRSGGYSASVILSERPWLGLLAQKEVRESVFNGRGLLVAGSHDKRNHFMEPALGVVVAGRHPWAAGLELLDDGTRIDLPYRDKVQVAFKTGAELTAQYELAWDQDADDLDHFGRHGAQLFDDLFGYKRNALTLNQYGKGKAVFAGFDWLAMATAQGDNSPLMQQLLQAIATVQPATLATYAGGVVPVTVTLTNEGSATPGLTALTLNNASVAAAGDFTEQDGDWTSIFSLEEEQALKQSLYLRLESAGQADVAGLVFSGEEDSYIEQASLTLDVPVAARPALNTVKSDLDQLAWRYWYTPHYRIAYWKVKAAQKALEKQHIRTAHALLIKATNLLLLDTKADVVAVRQGIDGEIERLARLLN